MKRRLASAAVCAGLSVMPIAGCASDKAQREPAPPPRTRSSPMPALSPAAYVAAAAQKDLFVERASSLAAQRSPSPRIRLLAAALAEEHRGLAGQLSLAGRRLNLLPRAALEARYQLYLQQLATTGNFNHMYLQHMIAAHREALGIHQTFARAGASPTLRPVAQAAAAVERRHVEQLRVTR